MDKLTIAEVEAELEHAQQWDGATAILQQLRDTMRENERLQKEVAEYEQDMEKLVQLVTRNKHSSDARVPLEGYLKPDGTCVVTKYGDAPSKTSST